MERGTGRTTRQIENAPKDSIFVWVNSNLHYPKELARKLNREDLRIVPPYWVKDQRYMGSDKKITLDHSYLEFHSLEDVERCHIYNEAIKDRI